MFAFVIGIIILVAAIVEMLYVKTAKLNKVFTLGGVGMLIVAIIVIVLGSIKTVPTGATGIVVTFGRIENVSLDAGLYFMAPWKSVVTMDNRTQKTVLELSCFSSDIQEVTVRYAVNYQIDKTNAQEIYRTIGIEYFDTVIKPKVLEAVKSVVAKYTAESLISSRGSLSQEIENILVATVAGYNVQIVGTSLENIDFTDAFTNAVEAKQVAEQNKLKAKTEQEQANLEAEASAERQKIQAQATADAAIIAAQADAEIAKISAESAEFQGQKNAAIMSNLGAMLQRYPELIAYYRATGWDGKLPTTMLGDNVDVLFDKN